MFEQLKKSFDKGVEFAFMTKDKIQQSVKEIAKENNLNKEEAKKLLDQLLKKSEEVRSNLEVRIAEMQKAAIDKMNLVTREDYKKLEERIKKLEGTRKVPARVKVGAGVKGNAKKSPAKKK
jgi:polyhydroxyalkanoate synthesis regulator phasin